MENLRVSLALKGSYLVTQRTIRFMIQEKDRLFLRLSLFSFETCVVLNFLFHKKWEGKTLLPSYSTMLV